ncbi:hypothetical protein [Pseudalkalibacillus sp. SCS-8]|uniref:hypothetical protein n=1 Tax=Pseudalkalibacillus nanhaiensis TaxID=3115291 RepID=UPI0032DB4D7E
MKKHLRELKKQSSLNKIHFSEQKKRETFQKIKGMTPRKEKPSFLFNKSLSFAALSILLVLVGTIGYESLTSESGGKHENQPSKNHIEQEDVQDEKRDIKLTDDKAKMILNTFYEKFFPEVDEKHYVKQYNTKEEMIKQMQTIASEEVTSYWMDHFYHEENGKLHLETLHGMPKINFKLMTLERVDEKVYSIDQEQENNLNGRYAIHVTFEYISDKWMITKYDVDYLEN